MTEKTMVVIGGGPAGIAAAQRGAQLGARVTLVSDGPVGGRAGWHSLLPSKVWLSAADMGGALAAAPEVGYAVSDLPALEEATLLDHLRLTKEAWAGAQQTVLTDLGVKIMTGRGRFVDRSTLEVTEGEQTERLAADAFVVATGSVPVFPPGLKPDGLRVIAPRFASGLAHLPVSIVVVGGGATGSEFAYLFSRLGVATTWVVDEFGVLPGYLPELGAYLQRAQEAAGVRAVQGSRVTEIDRSDEGVRVRLADGGVVEAEMAFVAVGRRPDVGSLALEVAGVELVRGLVQADEYGQTANPQLYVAGDAAGGRLVANKAMSQGRIAAAHALGAVVEPYDPRQTVLATYTQPEIAQIGELDAPSLRTVRLAVSAGLKARLEHQSHEGFVMLAYEPESGRVVGAAAAGSHAADMLAPVAIGLRLGATIADLAALHVAHPTGAELVFEAARLAVGESRR